MPVHSRIPTVKRGRLARGIGGGGGGGVSTPGDYSPTLWIPSSSLSAGTPIDTVTNAGSAGGTFTQAAGPRPDRGSVLGVDACSFVRANSDRMTSTLTAEDLIDKTAYHWFAVIDLSGNPATTSTTWYVDEAVMADSGQFWQLGALATITGQPTVCAGHWDGAQKGAADNITPGTPTLVEGKFNGTTITLQSGSRTPVTAAAGTVVSAAGTMRFGSDSLEAQFANGVLADVSVWDRVLSADERAAVRAYYALTFAGVSM